MRRNVIAIFVFLTVLPLAILVNSTVTNTSNTDYDPLVDIEVTVEIQAVRFLEEILVSSFSDAMANEVMLKDIIHMFFPWKTTDDYTPSFYIKAYINEDEFTSPTWTDSKYVYEPWTATLNVPDDEKFVDVQLQLWDANGGTATACDISGENGGYDVYLVYNILTGRWTGDDNRDDASGYGRLCGTDDGSVYAPDNDCELWFNIYHNDYDNDMLPYWVETHDYYTNPLVDNRGQDRDQDGIPIEWEHRWGYNPFKWDDHNKTDDDNDSLSNYEEYLTSEWLSDPFRKDVFVELDMMDDGPNGETVYFPAHSEELLNTAFDRQNVVFHLDYGDMGGHDRVPFDDLSTRSELDMVYEEYFLDGDPNNWRRGIFHYGIVTYAVDGAPGWAFRADAFQLASQGMEDLTRYRFLNRDIIYASGYMHELGHTFSFWPIPGHSQRTQYPWQIGYWINRPYYSCMNYGYVYTLVDYSNGTNRWPDIDDWNRINYSAFESNWH